MVFGLQGRKVRGFVGKRVVFCKSVEENLFLQTLKCIILYKTKKKKSFVFIEILMPMYAASTLVCVQFLVKMVD